MANRQWDERSFFEELRKQCSPSAYAVALKLLAWMIERGYKENYGEGAVEGTLAPSVYHVGQNRNCKLFEMFTALDGKPGRLLLASYLWANSEWAKSPFGDEAKRISLIHQLNKLPLREPLPDDAFNKRPRVALEDLSDEQKLKTFMEVHEWIAKELIS